MKTIENFELLLPYCTFKGCEQYYRKTYEQIIKFHDGFVAIDKPEIKKNFCYGYDDFGVQGGCAQAHELAEATKKHSTTFIQENLNQINRETQWLEDNQAYLYHNFREVYYRNRQTTTKWFSLIDQRRAETALANNKPFRLITEEERQILLTAYYQRAENFKKRLLTYLKKYGTSKLKVWTYLVD